MAGRSSGSRRPLVGGRGPVDRRAAGAVGDALGEYLSLRPRHLGSDGRARRGRVSLRRPLAKCPERGALACLWLAVLTVPLTLVRAMLADTGIHFLPPNLENPLVLAGAVSLVCWAMMASLRDRWSPAAGWSLALAACVPMFGIAVWSPAVTAVFVAAAMLAFVGWPLVCRSLPSTGMWDQSLLRRTRRFAGGPVLGSGG